MKCAHRSARPPSTGPTNRRRAAHPLRWLVAALEFDMVVDNDFQRRVQFGTFSEDADLAVIDAHGTLDTEAAAIDWDDPTVVLRASENGTITVADAVADLAKWVRRGWAWIAADRNEFASLSLARVMGPPRCHEHGTTRRCHGARPRLLNCQPRHAPDGCVAGRTGPR